jgi:hypothetical protein
MHHQSLTRSLLTLIVLATTLLTGCAVFEPADCRKADLTTYADAVTSKIKAFQQQGDLVAATPRVGLGMPLQRLLDLQNETRAIEAPGCLRHFHENVLEAMEIQQHGFQQFAAQQNELVAVSLITMGKENLATAVDDLEALRAGVVPTPVPTPEPVSPPEPGAVEEVTLLEMQPNGTGAFQVCPDDQFVIVARRSIGEASWVKVRITRIGKAACTELLPRAPKDFEGWLPDGKVRAP